MTPRVSIVINNYNYGRYVRQAIDSALGQTYQNTELLIVDDGSTDESRSVISGYADRARIFMKENGGQASAFNVGIREARGDYILLLDSDDYLFPDAIEVCLRAFPTGYSRVYFRLKVVDGDGNPVSGYSGRAFFREFDGDVSTVLAAGERLFLSPTSANLFHAGSLKASLPVPETEFRICADAFIAVRTSLRGPIRSIDCELGAYRIHGGNNFIVKSRFLSDPKVLRNRIDDHFRIPALLESACTEKGFSYKRESDESNFALLEMLCAGHKLNVDSPHVTGLTKLHLLKLVADYLRSERDPLFMRVRRTIYFSVVLLVPGLAAKLLLRLKDAWSYRQVA